MFEIKEREKLVERALLVGAFTRQEEADEAEDLLKELEELVHTLGIPVLDKALVYHRESHSRYLLGSGKAEEIREKAQALNADVLIFDNELTPAQQRNWEELTRITVLDRQEIILDIFGARARTKEARLQVSLARMAYSLPRLTRAWSHLGQQGGGIGAKGEGETQLEQDRRKIRGQMDRLKREIQEVRKARATQRKDRQRTPVPSAAIVGYTNAGKSSLLRRLTGADVLVEDKLFATLDTTTRKVDLPNKQPLLLTDTVGFVRKLPHQLVESFNATLEEAAFADFLIHVLDASHPRVLEFFDTTMKVLSGLGADTKKTIVAFNKIDKIEDPTTRTVLRHSHPDAVFLSVKTGEGIPQLISRIEELVRDSTDTMQLRLPLERADLIARLHRSGKVHSLEYSDNHAIVSATIQAKNRTLYSPYAIP